MKLLITTSAIIVCLNLNAQKDKFFSSKWRDNNSESVAPALSDYTATKKGDFFYCLSNDDKNIYVDAKITESIEENRVLQMGMTIWINTDGKSRKITGIRYPIGAQYSKGKGNTIAKTSPLALANTIELVGFKDVETNKFPSNNTDNVRGSVKYDNDGNLVFSLTVPRSKLPAGAKSKDGSEVPMNLAIEYGAPPSDLESGKPAGYTPPPKAMGEKTSRSVTSDGGGRGGRGGSTTSGGGAHGGDVSAQDEPQPVTIWMKNIKLAVKK